MNIYIANLNFSTKTESLQQLFESYGEVTSAKIITDRDTGRSRGFGFVEMSNEEEAQKAMDELNNTEFEGKTIVVNEAKPKESNGGGRSFGGGGRSGGYGGGKSSSNGGGYKKKSW
ncbi:MAG: RNA-binding protein [Sphingobacteriales bacterium]|jgi:RNA recognition motif-containing protein|nr:MAG: RNA-binding protein [Sphingobacteriales bacterium]